MEEFGSNVFRIFESFKDRSQLEEKGSSVSFLRRRWNWATSRPKSRRVCDVAMTTIAVTQNGTHTRYGWGGQERKRCTKAWCWRGKMLYSNATPPLPRCCLQQPCLITTNRSWSLHDRLRPPAERVPDLPSTRPGNPCLKKRLLRKAQCFRWCVKSNQMKSKFISRHKTMPRRTSWQENLH